MVARSPAHPLFHHRFGAIAGAFLLLAGLFPAALAAPAKTAAVSPDIVISQVYGGGGNSGATLTNDFIELFNRGTSTVDLTGWSVQYASATGTGNFNPTQINGSLAPGHYYLVQEAAGSGGTVSLPTPDATGSIAMSATGGKVIVANVSTAITCNGGSTACSSAQLAQIVDLVGYGGANFYEGAAAPGLSNTTAAIRAGGGCSDTDNNSDDFTAGAPNPRNTASPANVCSSGPGQAPVINEFSASTTGADVEYVEIYGEPSTDLSALTVLEIEGDASSTTGTVDEVIAVGTTDSSGFWLENLPANALENGTITLLMVSNFTGALGNDLDTDDDGTLDVTPWTAIVDAVAVNDGGAGDLTYGVPTLGVAYDGLSFAPGGASRIPDGVDTDTTADWVRNDFDLAGIPGYAGSPVLGEAYNTPGEPNEVYVPPPTGECGDSATYIHAIQGDGLASPLVGESVIIEGIVVGDFQNNAEADSGDLNGFYVQEEDADADSNPATSEGVFVYAPGGDDVAVGDRVRVLATVSEYTTSGGSSQTELSGVGGILVCASGQTLPTKTDVSLPVSSTSDLEAFEGMLINFPQPLSISEFFNFDRFNEVVLTDGRQYQPTAVAEPGSPEADAVILANALGRITLDDGRTNQNPPDLRHPDGQPFTLDHRFRGGDTVTNVTGVIDESFGLYRIQPTANASYSEVNPRPAEPEDVGGSLHVASFNVLNYFTTIDDGTNDICGPAQDQECRGADDANELARQRAKIVAALSQMNADVVGLIEIENNIGDGPTADLVAGLNDALGAGTYDYIPTGAIGTDAIRVALIYKPASVSPVGSYAVLDSSVDPRFDDTRNRPALAQSFEEVATGGVFTLAVNHLKSKGSACGAPDDDPQQGNCNATRTSAAAALVDWVATDPTGSGDRDALIMGDLNSYDKEDPISAIRAGADDATGTNDDYTDLIDAYQGELAYSYLFDGQLGYLDTALAGGTIASQVTGATVWHINADEPDILDYDTSFKPPEQAALYAPDAYRSSDHDPVIVGLDLAAYDFDGLYPPIDPSDLNVVKAGSTVPVKFSLGGDYGLDVLFEPPQVFDCGNWPLGASADAETPGRSMLSYDPTADQYNFTWKTSRSWTESCKTLEVTFADGTYVTASFDFVR